MTYLQHVWLGREAVWKVFELRDAVRKAHGKLVVQELSAQDKLSLHRVRAEVQHIAQGHAGLLFDRAAAGLKGVMLSTQADGCLRIASSRALSVSHLNMSSTTGLGMESTSLGEFLLRLCASPAASAII